MLGIFSILADFVLLSSVNKNRIIIFASLIIKMYALVFIDQSRVKVFIAVIVCLVFALYKIKNKKIRDEIALITILISIVSLVLLSFEYLEQLKNDYSFSARISSYKYYFGSFFSSNFLGNGFSSDEIYPFVQKGIDLDHYYSDVGIVGLFGKIGVFAIFFFLLPIFFIWRQTAKHSFSSNPFLIAASLVLLFSLPTLAQVSLNYPLTLVLILVMVIPFSVSNRKVRKIHCLYDGADNRYAYRY